MSHSLYIMNLIKYMLLVSTYENKKKPVVEEGGCNLSNLFPYIIDLPIYRKLIICYYLLLISINHYVINNYLYSYTSL